MSKEALTFETYDRPVRESENVIKRPIRGYSAVYYTGVDLGTACVVTSVLDENLRLVAGSYRYTDVVRDGAAVDYIGAIRIVREMKEKLEKKLGTGLVYTVAATPPDTDALGSDAIKNVIQDAGFEITVLPDEPTAANAVLNIRNGAVADIGGGTTGISMPKDGGVVYAADEPTGGIHFSLVISGAYQLSLEEADAYKWDRRDHREPLPVSKPVIEEVSTIIDRHIGGRDMDGVYSVRGTCCFTGTGEIIEKKIGVPIYKLADPMFITPLGIAKNCASACR